MNTDTLVDHSLVLTATSAEVDQKANVDAGALKVMEKLGFMDRD
jgi:hypothetical protein